MAHLENCYFTFQIAKNKGADQTARVRRLVCAFVFCKQQSKSFSSRGTYDVEANAPRPPPGYAKLVTKWRHNSAANQINKRCILMLF